MTGAHQDVSYEADIKNLVGERDHESMTFSFGRWSYDVGNDSSMIRSGAGPGTIRGPW
jgi:hypothetical protein